MNDLWIRIEDCPTFVIGAVVAGVPPSDPHRMSAANEAFAYGEYQLDEGLTQGGHALAPAKSVCFPDPDFDEDF